MSQLSNHKRQQRSCAFFFIGPGLVYATITARMPALKAQIGADEAQIGLILLCFGLAALVGLFSAPWLIKRMGSRKVVLLATITFLVGLPFCGLCTSILTLGAMGIIVGLGEGWADVAVNTQGIQLEHRIKKRCMAGLHACYSLGGVLGSLGGSLFAALALNTWVNFSAIAIVYALLLPFAAKDLADDFTPTKDTPHKEQKSRLPLFVWLCGCIALCSYAAEGSVAEWGSLLLYIAKGATEQTAALAFGVFSITMVVSRLFGDWLREVLGDFPLTFIGGCMAMIGIMTAILSPWPILCLGGYILMGLGLGPIVPILFSRAGDIPNVSPSAASAIISVMGSSGVLFFPPTLGGLAKNFGLETAMLVIFALCVAITFGSCLFRQKNASSIQ